MALELLCVASLLLYCDTAFAKISLAGSGATFPTEVYNQWRSAYKYLRSDHADLSLDYTRTNSWRGKRDMLGASPDYAYGGSELDLTTTEEALEPGLAAIPVIAGGIVLTYNVPEAPEMTLSREAIVGIYSGTVTRWDDYAIQKDNPGRWLPGREIIPIARADRSGTTEIFTAALSAISPEWNSTYGTFSEGLNDIFGSDTPIHWNASIVKYYGRTNRGMTGLIYSYRNSIGYVAIGETLTVNQTYAKVINRANQTVDINVTSTEAVMVDRILSVTPQTKYHVDLVDSSLPNAYPFLGMSYFVVQTVDMEDCLEARELYMYMEWILTSTYAEELADALRYNAMLSVVADDVVANVLSKMTCGDGTSVKRLVLEQRENERWMERTPLRIGVSVGVAVLVVLLASFVTYAIIHRIRLRNALRNGDWNIKEADIDIKWDREKGWLCTMESSRFSNLNLGSGVTGMKSAMSEGAGSELWSLLVVKFGKWNNKNVSLRRFPKEGFRITKDDAKISIVQLTAKIIQPNILRFYGVAEIDNILYLVSDHAEKGSLTDVLQNPRYKLDDNFKYALALDVAAGMEFLHNNHLIHGSLSTDSCLLDARWNVKITQWEILPLFEAEKERKLSRIHPASGVEEGKDENLVARFDVWVAPEILRSLVRQPDKKTDVYSFAILLVAIFTREDPYTELTDNLEASEIVRAIVQNGLRPDLSEIKNGKIKPIILSSWQEDPNKRPTFANLGRELRRRKHSKKSVIESMMDTLEEYVLNLEEKVQERTSELAGVNKSLENLLHQILPPSVAMSLSRGENVQPEHFDTSTIYFSDIVGFTNLCAQSTPLDVVNLLNDLYTLFDSVLDKMDVYKVETIGDAYMCISGVPIRNGTLHAKHIAEMGLKLMSAVKTFRIRHRPATERLQLRAGIHSGPVVAGVVGVKMPRYCLFGDTVNTASRMESTSVAMRVQVSEVTHALLLQLGGYQFEDRGKITVKGKGEMNTYFLLGATEVGLNQNWQPPQKTPERKFGVAQI